MNSKAAPIVLFVYNRLDTLTRAIQSLQRNRLAGESELFVFSDHARSAKDIAKVAAVRDYIRNIDGFLKLHIKEAEWNKGLSPSVISGVSEIINRYGKVIVLEDDLVTSKNFLSFLNQALEKYEDNKQVFSIGGYSGPISGLRNNETYFTQRATSWGWATWKEKWNAVDWEVKGYKSFSRDRQKRAAFNRMGSDMSRMLDRQMRGEIDSWAIRWCFHQFMHDLYTVFPAVSKVRNIGFQSTATHTKDNFNRFETELDKSENESFVFSDRVVLDKEIIRQFVRPYSIVQRVRYKLLNAIPHFL